MSESDWRAEDVTAFTITPLFNKVSKPSFMWQHFGQLVLETNNKRKVDCDRVYCRPCLKAECCDNDNPDDPVPSKIFRRASVKNYSVNVSTGNLSAHLQNVHAVVEPQSKTTRKMQVDLRTMFTTERATVAVPATSPSQRKWRLARDLVLMIARDLTAFERVQSEGFVDFMQKYKVIEKKSDLPDPRTLARTAFNDVYDAMHQYIVDYIKKGPRFACITFDLWTDKYRKRNYITFTYHHITSSFKLESFTLSTHIIHGKQDGENICNEISQVKEKYGLESKKLHSVTDRGGNVQRATRLADLENDGCLGHAIHNLITADEIEKVPQVKKLVGKLRKVVKALRYRAVALDEMREEEERNALAAIDEVADQANFQVEESEESPEEEAVNLREVSGEESTASPLSSGQEPMDGGEGSTKRHESLKTYSQTRWDGLLHLSESLISYEAVINRMVRMIGQPGLALTPVEWENLKQMVEFLQTLRTAVKIMSAESATTLNLALLLRSEIKAKLEIEASDNGTIKAMKRSMLANFDRRFPVTELMVTASLLDPRFSQLTEVDQFLSDKEVTRVSFLTEQIKKLVRKEDLPKSKIDQQPTSASAAPASGAPDLLSSLAKKHSVRVGADADCTYESAIEIECAAYVSSLPSLTLPDGDLLGFWAKYVVHFSHFFADQYPDLKMEIQQVVRRRRTQDGRGSVLVFAPLSAVSDGQPQLSGGPLELVKEQPQLSGGPLELVKEQPQLSGGEVVFLVEIIQLTALPGNALQQANAVSSSSASLCDADDFGTDP